MLLEGTPVTVIRLGGIARRLLSTRVNEGSPIVGRVSWSDTDGGVHEFGLFAEDEGIFWARGHGDDVEAVLLLTWSARVT